MSLSYPSEIRSTQHTNTIGVLSFARFCLRQKISRGVRFTKLTPLVKKI